MMKAISLMYHDVVELTAHETSGFAGADAATYKIAIPLFDEHLFAIADAMPQPPVLVSQLAQSAGHTPWMLTFDDGGASAISAIADRLEALNWRGHFFVTAGCIGKALFLNNAQIRELHKRGHIVGSHSYTHPLRMATLSGYELKYEWETSIEKLSGIVGERVSVASIPGGQYSRKIAETASAARITTLFTSEPITACHTVDRCQLFGRYAIRSWTNAELAAALAKGNTAPRIKQLMTWNARKALKKLGGVNYLKVRELLLRSSENIL